MSVNGSVQNSEVVYNVTTAYDGEGIGEDTQRSPEGPGKGESPITQQATITSDAEAPFLVNTEPVGSTWFPSASQEQTGADILDQEGASKAGLSNEPAYGKIEASERGASKGLMSEGVAAQLRSKKISALVPVTAADLIWLDAKPSEDDLDD